MSNLAPSDRAALEIGRMFMRAHAAEQQAEMLARELAETKAALAEFTNGVEKGDVIRKPRAARKRRTPARRS